MNFEYWSAIGYCSSYITQNSVECFSEFATTWSRMSEFVWLYSDQKNKHLEVEGGTCHSVQ